MRVLLPLGRAVVRVAGAVARRLASIAAPWPPRLARRRPLHRVAALRRAAERRDISASKGKKREQSGRKFSRLPSSLGRSINEDFDCARIDELGFPKKLFFF